MRPDVGDQRTAAAAGRRRGGRAVLAVGLTPAVLALAAGCQRPPGPIFPEVSPPIEWPPPPDQPRIRYVGELRGEADLGQRAAGWAAVQEILAGPRAQVAFSRPVAVAVADELVFVADTGLGVVHRLDLAARRYRVLRGNPDDPLRVPISLAVGGDRLVVADRGRGAVEVFALDGDWRRTQRWPELTAPVAVAWDGGRRLFWLADAAAHACWSTTDLRALGPRVGGRGAELGRFHFPTALAADPTGGLLVADAMNFRIQRFPASGPATAFGQKGNAAGDFSLPRGVAVDGEGHVYVVDSQFENVQVFDAEGRLLMAFGEGGEGRGQFSLPSGIAIDARDRIWVADGGNHRVQVFQYLPEQRP